LSVAAKKAIDTSLQAASDLSAKSVEEAWKLLINDSEFFRQVSFFAASFAGLFVLSFFIVQEMNRRRDKDDQLNFFISTKQYLIMLLIAACLIAPNAIGTAAYEAHRVVSVKGAELQKTLAAIGGDPNLAMAEIQAGKDFAANGIKICDTYPSVEKQAECRKSLSENIRQTETSSDYSKDSLRQIANTVGDISLLAAGPAGSIVKGAINAAGTDVVGAAGSVANTLGEAAILTLLIPLFLLIGTAFLIALDIGQLAATILLPFVLLLGLYNPARVFQFGKSFMSWGLISFSYKVIVTTVGFVMLKGNVSQTGLYAVLVGVFAPWAAYQVVSGSSLGIMSAVSSAARSAIGR
jgi:hypothetical protein